MTTVMTREPLQTINMASTQRATRRRTVVHAFDDENEAAQPSTKRARTERPTNRIGKKPRASYDEDDDGFQFSRSKAKKTQTQTAPPPEPIAESVAEETTVATPPKRRRKKYSFSEADGKDKEEMPKTRRSKRLSGEKAENAHTPIPISRRVKKVQDEPPKKDAPAPAPVLPAPQPAPVCKSPKKIALPFADTPVIRRNKEMRKNHGAEQGHRRSSTGIRGRRASSLIESGQSNAVPHIDVEMSDFYKHIEQSIPEPRRMQQLLMWCATRAMPEKQSGGDGSDGGAALAGTTDLPIERGSDADTIIARHIEEEILKDLSNKPEMSDWFSREELAPVALVRKPNPRNEQMATKLQELELEIKRLEDERDSWESLFESSSAPISAESPPQASQTSPLDGERRPKLPVPPPETKIDSNEIDPSLLDPAQAAIYESLNSTRSSDSAETLSRSIASLTAKLEPAIDVFADGVHRLSQYRIAADRVADRVLLGAAKGLERRSRDVRAQAASERGVNGPIKDMKPVLEALAGALNGE